MIVTPRTASLPLALAVAFAAAPADAATTLLRKLDASVSSRSALKGVGRVAPVALDRRGLAALRATRQVEIADFPVGPDRTATLDVHRIEPFAPGARIEEVSADGVRRLPAPDRAYFAGRIRGEPDSRVLVVAAPDSVEGFVLAGGEMHPFGPDGRGGYRAYAMRDVDVGAWPPPPEFCTNGVHRDVTDGPARAKQALRALGFGPAPLPLAADTLLRADVAIVTDYELYQTLGSSNAVTTYVGNLMAAATAIYERDTGVQLVADGVKIYATASDPWTQSGTLGSLYELQDEWGDPSTGLAASFGPVDLVHFVSGKSVTGGVAYLDAVCDDQFYFGVSQVYGSFDLSVPSSVWDVLVFTHELGHNFGSPHTHCYSPPLDQCYNGDSGCYSGPIVTTRGTIMSYCHLYAGVANVDLEFGPTVSQRIRDTVAGASCLSAGDGGGGGGGGPGGGGGGGGGSAKCGDGSLHPGEACDDGNTVDGDGCSASCQVEPGCGDGAVGDGEECDDGNRVDGDGCSAACVQEPCTVTAQPQYLWDDARLEIVSGKRLAFRGLFGPAAGVVVDPAAIAATGVRLRIDGADGSLVLDAVLPAGGWSVRRRRAVWRGDGSLHGIRKVTVRDRTRRGIVAVQVIVSARGAVPQVAESALPLTVTVVLGDATAGAAGACGRRAFGAAACDTFQKGRRVLCR